jgi:indolepyruvate decarboxylase
MAHSMASSYSIGDYLIHSLYGRGITHVFGVPGDYILSFYDRLTKSKISVVNTCDEQGAGFAAAPMHEFGDWELFASHTALAH